MLSKKKFIPIFEKYKSDDIRGTASDHQKWYISELLDKEYGFNLIDLINDADGKENYKDSYTEKLKDQVPDNFCLYPFTHFQLDPDGRARPCCKYKVGDADWQKDVPKLPEYDIGQLWEQDEFQQLRSEFLRNKRPSGCKACWDEEAAGIKSMRLQRENGGKDHPYATFYTHIPRLYPKTLDLKLSNLCNLKCRICTPFLSSQWMKEIKDLNILDMGSYDTFVSNSREKFSENTNNEVILKEWAPSLDYLEFYGGEPFMQQEHEKILRIIHEYGKPSKTGLYYNTNGSICKEEFFKLWAPFNEVIINFSIDDQGERFEYQRKNAKWDETLENIKKYKQFSEQYNVNMSLRIYTTVGILNVFYLKEFFDEIKKLDIKIMLNMVHYPHHYSITNLPTNVKDIVKEKLLLTNVENILADSSPTIYNIINFMYNSEMNPALLQTFFDKTMIHDNYRNESFKKVFPELYELLKSYNE